MNEFTLSKFFPVDPEKVFTYWTVPQTIEQWSYPDGMSLKVPEYEGEKGGQYRYEHTADNGVYIGTGYFKEFIPNKKLVQVDMVKDPNGTILFEELETTVEFKYLGSGTEVTLTVRGFEDQKSVDGCKQAWEQCIDHLKNLLRVDLIQPGQDWDEEGRAPLSP
jgi:uncharacterized protein YndB with AHSA1/START domain